METTAKDIEITAFHASCGHCGTALAVDRPDQLRDADQFALTTDDFPIRCWHCKTSNRLDESLRLVRTAGGFA